MSNPSLILPQSPAYGEDYVYAAQVNDGVVPLYNVLPLTFTRASGGTRINKDGLVQDMPYNLLGYSEDFTNGVWALSNVTITTNAIANPINGQTNAELATCASGSSISPNIYYQTSFAATNGQVYNYSYYAKKGGSNFAKIRFSGSAFASVTNSPIFNLNTGVVVSGTGTIESVGNGWYRISASATAEANASAVVTIDIPSSTGVWPNGNFTGAESIYIFGAQVNIGSTAQPYLATTDRLNMPRITYPVGGGCGALLLEKQSTNLILHSEQFDNVDWTKAQGNGGSLPIITANYGISPDGTQNADRIQLTRTTQTSSFSYVYQTYIGTIGVPYTWSIWLKSLSGTPSVALSYDGSSYINIVTLTTQWQRYTFTSNAINTSLQATFLLFENLSGTSLSADFLAWGFQLEASSYATSYIPTTSTSATRIADSCYKTGISNLIGQTEGVIFVDFVCNGIKDLYANIINSEKNVTNSFYIHFGLDGYIRAGVFANSVQRELIASGFVVGQRYKLAFAYKSGDLALYSNGIQKATTALTFAFNSSLDDIYLNDTNTYFGYQENFNINEVILFPTRLTNAELATLTS